MITGRTDNKTLTEITHTVHLEWYNMQIFLLHCPVVSFASGLYCEGLNKAVQNYAPQFWF